MRQCFYCGKSYKGGGTRKLLRGHYNPTNFSKKRVNLQLVADAKSGVRVLSCTSCMRTKVKVRKPRAAKKPLAKKTA
ncbi:MAG: hypothetical protein A2901_03700 [Elusimicrobia bacterium RIFCSPLOWO2_01_FULL_54_10]|nr:MAG: hypothetical protein A2901_03700 [Elusimicrobia bacterium RIFCSPLOWO2_01_FULL_54_10]